MTPEPYYDDGQVTMFHEDALGFMRDLLDDQFDLVVTSPPYNMGLTPGGNGRGTYSHRTQKAARFSDGYGAHDDAMPQDEYDEWQRACLAEMYRVARLGVFYNHRPRVEHGRLRTPLSWDFGDVPLRQVIVWDRGTGIDVNLRHYCTRQEWVLLFAGPEFALRDHSSSGRGDVWRLGMERGVDGHPCPFPVSLPAQILDTVQASSVLDPFCGSGSTLVAARDRGVLAVGVDNHEPYLALAAERVGGPIRATPGSLFGADQ